MAVPGTLPKHWTLGILLLFFAFFLAACGGSDSPELTSTSADSTTVAPPSASSGVASPTPEPQSSSSSGGGNVGLEETLDQVIMLFEELLDVLVDVTDEASAKAAAGEVMRIEDQLEELEKRMDEYSDEEIARAALSTRFFGFANEIGEQMIRISANPAALALLGSAFESLGSGAGGGPTGGVGPTRSRSTVAPVAPTALPVTGDLSAGGSACLLFGQLIATFSRATDPSFILDIADAARSIQSSAEQADEEEIRDAIEGMVDSVNDGIPDVNFAVHMDAMTQACLSYYSEEYLTGFTQ